MNLPATLNPANARSAPLPAAAEEASSRSTGTETNSFSSVLDSAASPPRERAPARWRSAQGRAGDGSEAGDDARPELKPIKAGRKKGCDQSPESLAGAVAVAPAPVCMEVNCSQGRQFQRPPPVAPGGAPGVLVAVGLNTPPAPAASPALPSTGAKVIADDNGAVATEVKPSVGGPIELLPVAKAESSIVEKPEPNAAEDINNKVVYADQPTADVARSAGTNDLIPPNHQSLADEVKPAAVVSVELLRVAKAEASIVEKPESAAAGDINHKVVSADQPTVDVSQSAGTNDLIPSSRQSCADKLSERGGAKSERVAPLETERNETKPAGAINPDESRSAGPNARVDDSENFRGIAAAKLGESMKNTEKQDEIAASTKQILPGVQTVQLRPARADTRREGRRNLMESGFSETRAGAVSANSAGPATGTELLLASDGLTDRLASVDRMTKVISREVQMFKRTADETMEVVLTPDQRTQISLRLQWREGKVEILAHCQQGDYHTLNTQWPQLQTALAQQGVQLSPLTQPAHTGYTEFFSATGFSQSQNGGQRQPEPKVALDKLPPVAAIPPAGKTPPRVIARARRLLESWA